MYAYDGLGLLIIKYIIYTAKACSFLHTGILTKYTCVF